MSSDYKKFVSEVRQYLVQFFDDLITQFPKERDLVMLKVIIENDVPPELLARLLHEHIYPVRHMIYQKDADFFLTRFKLFDALDPSKVSHFKRLWQDPDLKEDDKNTLWEWFSLFAKYTETYESRFKTHH